jgi:hypothetical protein
VSARDSAPAEGHDGSDSSDQGAHLRPRGSSQGGLRQYNERVVLQAVRLHGALPSADIARLTHLTAQTISLITKRRLDDGLPLKGAPLRGKVGQPSVPLSLNPHGAFAIGIKVGRRSMDVLLTDFTGAVRERSSLEYRLPDPDELLAEIGRRLAALRRKLGAEKRELVQGVGIAAPLSIGGWRQLLGFPPELAARWNALDLRSTVQSLSPWPVSLMKDTAATCVAELVAGRGRRFRATAGKAWHNRRCCPARSAPMRAHSAVRCCRCTPTSRPTASSSSRSRADSARSPRRAAAQPSQAPGCPRSHHSPALSVKKLATVAASSAAAQKRSWWCFCASTG